MPLLFYSTGALYTLLFTFRRRGIAFSQFHPETEKAKRKIQLIL
jgi:hypothetical protein